MERLAGCCEAAAEAEGAVMEAVDMDKLAILEEVCPSVEETLERTSAYVQSTLT